MKQTEFLKAGKIAVIGWTKYGCLQHSTNAHFLNIFDKISLFRLRDCIDLRKYGVNESKLFVIPESVDTELFRPDVEPLKGLKGMAGYNFLSIFKWEHRKGWDILLRAYLFYTPN